MKIQKIIIIIFLSLFTFLSNLAFASFANIERKRILLEEKNLSFLSPSKNIRVEIGKERDELFYKAYFQDKEIIGQSKLGLRFSNTRNIEKGLQLNKIKSKEIDENWELPWGEKKYIRNHYREYELIFKKYEDKELTLVFRLYDDGIAFRYKVKIKGREKYYFLVDELTSFNLKSEAKSWSIPAREWNRYEYLYEEKQVGELTKVHTPITIKQDDVYLAIHEAALVDYSGMSLKKNRGGELKADLAPSGKGYLAKLTRKFQTPWRMVIIGKKAVDLVNSDLLLNLNEPNKLGDVSYVKPSKYIGIWWGMHIGKYSWGSGEKHGATTERTKEYIDFAAKYGFDSVLVEGWNIGWDGDWFYNGDVFNFTKAYDDFDIDELAKYAKIKNVRLMGHHETSGSVSNYEKQMDDAFDLYEKLGISEIKTGYVADAGNIKFTDNNGKDYFEYHDGQKMAVHHLELLKKAHKRKIVINSHEPIKDTGLRRTYPNWISREGARGQEYNAWGAPLLNPPSHTVILPYTRLLSAPMDFTPGIFDLTFQGEDGANRVLTTLAKQLALYVIIYSPIQMAADLPENYEKNLKAFQFILDVETDFQDSIALDGEIGAYIIQARKAKNDSAKNGQWFVAAISNEKEREVEINLADFLDKDKNYKVKIYMDGAKAHYLTNPYDIDIKEKNVNANDKLKLHIAAGGGFALHFIPQN